MTYTFLNKRQELALEDLEPETKVIGWVPIYQGPLVVRPDGAWEAVGATQTVRMVDPNPKA